VRTERDLYERLWHARPIFDTIGDGLIVVGGDSRVLFCNEAARTLLGRHIENIEPHEWMEWYDFLREDTAVSKEKSDAPLIRAVRGEALTRQEFHLSGPTIRNVWLSIISRPITNEVGDFEWAYLLLRDINLRKWSEEKIKLHDRALASAAEGIVIADAREPDYPIIHVNDGFERLTGYDRDEVLGEGGLALLGEPRDGDDRGELFSAAEEGRAVAVEINATRKDGSAYWSRVSLTPVSDSNGDRTHFIVVMSDMTELKETEERLQRANDDLTEAHIRMKKNLEAAAEVQRASLPTVPPQVEGAQFAWTFEPTEELSGDCLNVMRLDDEHVGLYILDVSGHGTAAALLSVAVSRMLMPVQSATAMVYQRDAETGDFKVAAPSHVAQRLAMRFNVEWEDGKFFTMTYGVLDCRTREFRYVTAGHPAPVLVTSEGVKQLERTYDLPVGIWGHYYHERTVTLDPGARVYFYSDGVSEAQTPEGKLFGEERLFQSLQNGVDSSLEESIRLVERDTESWREGLPANDDMSLLAFELAPSK
jgi:PAS domain S-box-containing protein